MQRIRTLPSFTVLLTIVSLVVLVPLCAFGWGRWQEASTRVDASRSVRDSSERLQLLLQLAPALTQEEFALFWVDAGSGLFDGIDTAGGDQLVPDFGASLSEDTARVDRMASVLGDDEISTAIAVVRADAAAGTLGFFEYETRYSEIASLVEAKLGVELRGLNHLVADAGAGEVVQAERIAEAAAALQMAESGQARRWAQLHAAELFTPTLDDSVRFAARTAVLEERIHNLERIAPIDSRVGEQWLDVRSSRAAVDLRARYQETVQRFAASGVTSTRDPRTSLQANDLDLLSTLQIASGVREGFNDAAVFSSGIAVVVESSLDEIDLAADRAVASAESARRAILIWTLLFLALTIGGELALVLTVGRPVRRMAYTAQRLSRGHLDAVLRESGPTEVRLGARALNEALASIRIAEAQAMALADERLDDAILAESAPGELGASLHAAVNRLAEYIAERDDFQTQLEYEASHDHLTKLANRAAVLRHLTAAMARTSRTNTTMALLFLDIDDFKTINDAYGHHTGDAVLRTVADRLADTIREGDLAGRLGGDEFVVIAEPVLDIDAAVELSHRILDAVNEPITVEGVTFHPSVSIGVGLANASNRLTADELVRDADSAVYRAKGRGKGRVEVCDDELRTRIKARDSLELSIRRAIDHNELVLHFQPCVSAKTRHVESVEALVRWDQQDSGLTYPDAFIPAAERTDLILDIDRWVLDASIAQLGHWQTDPLLRELCVAVNISARHLGTGTLCDEVRHATERYGVSATNLILEVTETALLEDMSVAARELTSLRELGLQIALDDFGTGFMSLAHLRQLPVDILKIDRSFVAEIDSHADQSLVGLIVDTGHILGMTVTGEGVETLKQARALRAMKVDYLQGYFFGRPVSVVEIGRLVAEAQASDELSNSM